MVILARKIVLKKPLGYLPPEPIPWYNYASDGLPLPFPVPCGDRRVSTISWRTVCFVATCVSIFFAVRDFLPKPSVVSADFVDGGRKAPPAPGESQSTAQPPAAVEPPPRSPCAADPECMARGSPTSTDPGSPPQAAKSATSDEETPSLADVLGRPLEAQRAAVAAAHAKKLLALQGRKQRGLPGGGASVRIGTSML